MNNPKIKVHFTDSDLIDPTNPVSVNLIGAGGTGSQVLTALARMNHSLIALGHAGLHVTLWDDDRATPANQGRQLFADSEIGLHKAVALINRTNRFFGTHWKARTERFEKDGCGRCPKDAAAAIFISCVDTVSARFGIAEILRGLQCKSYYNDAPKYWVDMGNSQYTGQVILSSIGKIQQPKSEKFDTVAAMPFVTEEFKDLLVESEGIDNTPSCSLAEALESQDLFINSSLAQMGCSLLWSLFRNGMTRYRGFFLNLEDFRSQPILLS